MSDHTAFVSIIIPVFNDLERLRLCLAALENQTYPKDLYEVIVIDNNSEENIQRVTKDFAQVKLAQEKRQGSYAARNTGIAIARGRLLGFTDADCIPDRNWIESGVSHLERHPNCGLVAGRIDFYFQKPDCPNVAELWDSMNFLQQKRYIEDEHFGATANVFTSKAIFEQVGLFNSDLQSGGDREWGKRVFAAGYPQSYADDVRIQHPARASLNELKKKLVRVVEGNHSSGNFGNKSVFAIFHECFKEDKPSFKYIFRLLFIDNCEKSFYSRIRLAYIYVVLRSTRALKKLQLGLTDLTLERASDTQPMETK
jgi:glycosyltransferase involved in cell wall biosynthesis